MKRLAAPLALILSMFLIPSSAYAYLDPGTGSALLQGILGAIAAIGVVLKLYWHRLLRLLGIRKSPSNESKNTTQANADKDSSVE